MASPSPPFFSLYLLQEWFSTLFTGRPQGRPGCTDDEVILSARYGFLFFQFMQRHHHHRNLLDPSIAKPNYFARQEDIKQGILGTVDLKQGILEISETCDADLLQNAKEGEMLQQDGLSGRLYQHSHDGMPEMTTGFFSSPAKPFLPCFILDSRAACHVASNVSVFSSSSFTAMTTTLAASSAAATYLAYDGTRLAVAGVGTVSCDNFHLTDVLYVPGMRAGLNLVSVQQLAERDYLVMFGGGQCSVRERSTGKIVGKGRMHDDDGLYHLDFLTIP